MSNNYELVCYMKPYIQPFERTLARKELEALAGVSPIPEVQSGTEPSVYHVVTQSSPTYLANRLTYWERLHPNEALYINKPTRQVRFEATASLAQNGVSLAQLCSLLPFQGDIPLPNRRSLRYGPHGIHEYRGKFFPQLVRSLLNIAGIDGNATILDPMCGSGTTLVEAILLGYRAIGLDTNPLSALMSQAKCDALTIHPDQLIAEYESLKTDLQTLPFTRTNSLPWFDRLPTRDRDYLSRWFAPEVLADLDPITLRVHRITHPACRMLFRICLSNVLRRVSWQKNDDLRVRKEIHPNIELDVMTEFLTELDRSVKTTLAFLYENQGCQIGQAHIIEGDARYANQLLVQMAGSIDAIVTSPPYATALPYLDTDRLSLSYLNLLSRPEHRRRDYTMIGNREITNGARRQYWEEYEQSRSKLPDDITTVIDRINRLNQDADVGFRRRNLPALLARYFLDMRQVFESFQNLLRPGAPAYVVVGNNYTIAGGQRVGIETDDLLAQLGESVGFTLEETVAMEMLISRDIFKKNTGNAETILFLRKGQN